VARQLGQDRRGMVFRAGQLAQVSLDKIERTEWPEHDSKDMTTSTGHPGQDSRVGRNRQDRTAGTAELGKRVLGQVS
jgi:hypothetical protein